VRYRERTTAFFSGLLQALGRKDFALPVIEQIEPQRTIVRISEVDLDDIFCIKILPAAALPAPGRRSFKSFRTD
jgi:hypothetical protein